MLRVKKDKLQELEKFGFEKYEHRLSGLCYEKNITDEECIDEEYAGVRVANCLETRIVELILQCSKDRMTLEYYIDKYAEELYDLIQAGIVEKVVKND